MKDIPIIFSAPMVLALLDGRKTMTRRLLYSKRTGAMPGATAFLSDYRPPVASVGEYYALSGWHKVQPGDRLWVRESLQCFNRATAQYVADLTPVAAVDGVDRVIDGRAAWTWKTAKLPSIHMPRWASRITLVVTATKIERLQDISEADAMAEGVERAIAGSGETGGLHYTIKTFRAGFVRLWGELHGTDSWLLNPEVVALTFTVHKHNIDAMPQAEAA